MRLAPDLIIVGQEIDTATGGELIAYYVTERIPRDLPLSEEAIARLRERRARDQRVAPAGSAAQLGDGREADAGNDRARWMRSRCSTPVACWRQTTAGPRNWRRATAKPGTAGSDGHTSGRDWAAATWTLPPFKANPQAFLASLAQGTAQRPTDGYACRTCGARFAKLGK